MKLDILWHSMFYFLVPAHCQLDKADKTFVNYTAFLQSFSVSIDHDDIICDFSEGNGGSTKGSSSKGSGFGKGSAFPLQGGGGGGEGGGNTSEALQGEFIDTLYSQHNKLETVFRFFDKDGDGRISRDEFIQGCEYLNALLEEGEKVTDFDRLLGVLDIDQTGAVDINEFFECFRLSDAHKKQHEKRSPLSPMYDGHRHASVSLPPVSGIGGVGGIGTTGERKHSFRLSREGSNRSINSTGGGMLSRDSSVEDIVTLEALELKGTSIHVDGIEQGVSSPKKLSTTQKVFSTAPTSDALDI
jgi:hypothetical protein